MHIITSLPLAALLIGPLVGPVGAHPSLERREANIGASYKAIVRVPHGCEGSPTTRVRVQIPEGVIGVKPQPKPGWTIETTRGAYANSYPYYHGATLTEGVREISWSGRLADEHYDEFVFSGFVAATLKAGETVYFPTVQDCEKGSSAWVEIPSAGQSAHDLKLPAPAVQLVQAQAPSHGHHQAAAAQRIGSLVIETPWIRETPGGAKVAGGYAKITNNGKSVDRLIGGSLLAAKQVEVHEMAMVDSVMRMRRLEKGLEIKPGESIELKPGSYHLMFFELARPFKAGDTIKGTLVFEHAGEIAVEFKVNPMGARSGGGHSSGDHSKH
jgi:uncharacterized protein YcnI/copper(I)-binding protein